MIEDFLKNPSVLWVGAGALLGVLASMWAKARAFLHYITGVMVTRVELKGITLQLEMVNYLSSGTTKGRWRQRAYEGTFFSPAEGDIEYVYGETFHKVKTLVWLGWRPLWFSQNDRENNAQNVQSSGPPGEQKMVLSWIRGTISADRLIRDVAKYHDSLFEQRNAGVDLIPRHFCTTIVGQGNRPHSVNENCVAPSDASGTSSQISALSTWRLVTHTREGLLAKLFSGVAAADSVAMNEDMVKIYQDCKMWVTGKDWLHARGLQWSRGYLLHGEHGTGKTKFIRALGREFNVPVFVFNVASLSNYEFVRAWEVMRQAHAWGGVFAVIEDLHTVFDQDKAEENVDLNFSTFLSALDGIEGKDGIVVFITTNNVNKLDPRLATFKDGQFIESRRGRVDMVAQTSRLGLIGRRLIAKRIFLDNEELAEELVRTYTNVTGAEFQELCAQSAKESYYRKEREHA